MKGERVRRGARRRIDWAGAPPRWLVAALVVVGALVAAGGAWLYHDQESALRERAHIELRTIAGLKAEQIEAWRDNHLRTAWRLANSRLFAQIVYEWAQDPTQDSTQGIVQRMRAEQPSGDYFDVILVDPKGNELLRLGNERHPLQRDTIEAVRRATESGNPQLTGLYQGDETRSAYIDVVAPLSFVRDGVRVSPGAVVLQSSAEDFLFPLVERWPTPSTTAETTLVVRDGEYAEFLNDVRHEGASGQRPRLPVALEDAPAVKAVLGVRGVVEGVDHRGEAVLAYLAKIEGSEWYMVAKIDEAEALADWRDRGGLIVALALGLVALTGGGFSIIWQIGRASYLSRALEAERIKREGQELTLSLFRAAPIGLGVVVGGTFTAVSERFSEMLGYRREELLGAAERLVFTSERQYYLVSKRVRQSLAESGSAVVETRFRRNGGDGYVEVMLHVSAVSREDPSRGYSFAVLDITERKAREREVQTNNAFLEALAAISVSAHDRGSHTVRVGLDEVLRLTGSTDACFFELVEGSDDLRLECTASTVADERLEAHRARDAAGFERAAREALASRAVVRRDGVIGCDDSGLTRDEVAVGCMVAVPVKVDGGLAGVVVVGGAPRRYSEGDASRIALLIEGSLRMERQRHAAQDE